MSIIIGIALIVLAVGIAYGLVSVVVVKKATYVVIDEWGVKPIDLLDPGIRVICWPWHTVHDVISTEVLTDNLKSFIVTCQVVNGLANDTRAPDRPYGIADLKTADGGVSFNFRIRFSTARDQRRSELAAYYRLVKKTPDGKTDHSALTELLHDIIEELFREKTIGVNIYEARNPSAAKIKEIQDELAARCHGLTLPLEILPLVVNQPFEPTEKDVRDALMARSASQLKVEDDLVAAKGAILVAVEQAKKSVADAEGRLAVAKVEADVVKTSAAALATALGLDVLPPAEKVHAMLTSKALDVYKEIAASGSTKIVVSPNLLSEITSMLGALSGTKKGGKA